MGDAKHDTSHDNGGGGAVLGRLEALLSEQARADRPPLHTWSPPEGADIGLAIERDASWSYRGSEIRREALVRLFARVLMRDAAGRHWLVTPAEKVPVRVADAPFMVVEMSVRGGGEGGDILVRTNLDEVVVIGAASPLRLVGDPLDEGLAVYVTVRDGLEARLTRPVAYELIEHMIEAGDVRDGMLGLTSAGVFFAVVARARLAAEVE